MINTTFSALPSKEIILERLFTDKHINFQELLILLNNYYIAPFGVKYTSSEMAPNGTTTKVDPNSPNYTYTHGK